MGISVQTDDGLPCTALRSSRLIKPLVLQVRRPRQPSCRACCGSAVPHSSIHDYPVTETRNANAVDRTTVMPVGHFARPGLFFQPPSTE